MQISAESSATERQASRFAAQVLAAMVLFAVALQADKPALAQGAFNPYGSFTDSGPVTPEEKARREQVRTDLYDRLSPAYSIDVPFVSEASIAGLQQAIERYRQIVANGGWPVTTQKVTLRQGDTSGEIAAIRKHLIIEGDLGSGSGSNPTFDREFLDGLSRFQIRNGLRVSGFVDQRTLAALNVTATERLQQLETNLKRVQGLMSFNKAPRYVLVNVPFFVAQGVANGELSFESNVVAGKPARATPQVSAKIVEINFFPTWSVPEIVAQQDLIPKIRKDPSYFSQEHFMVMRDWEFAAARSGVGRLELAAGGELQVPPGARHFQRARRRAHQHAQQVQRLYARHTAQAAFRSERTGLLVRLRPRGKGAGARRLAARRAKGLDA